LLEAGHDIVIIDNFSNSSPEAVRRIEELSGKKVVLYEADIKDSAAIGKMFSEYYIDSVIHFAGLKAVGESIEKPLEYYRNNIDTTLTLLECMKAAGVKNVIFSSSATVYGEENDIPYMETMKRGRCTNPYGWTKVMMEQIFQDAAKADPELSVVLLRYFNPIGAHESGRIGEEPRGIPNNLMPYVVQVAVGRRDHLTIFGNDYGTPDGTCRRDFVHVMDLANGHLKAIEYAVKHKGIEIFNLGTAEPYSVLDLVHTFEKVNGVSVKYEFGPRRDGDIPDCWANAEKADKILGWKTNRTLEVMCRDAWNWQKNNLNGYRE
jgi:UDP-glucose 4-epimerase